MPRPDRHNEIEFNLLRSGSLTYLLGGHRITIPAGRLAVFWAAIPHLIVAAEGREPYFITHHRITHAQRLLVTTSDAILDIALAAGFQSLSRFNEAFKKACGCPPREDRKAHREI